MLSECIYKVLMASGVVTSSDACDLSGAIETAVLDAQAGQEPEAWEVSYKYGHIFLRISDEIFMLAYDPKSEPNTSEKEAADFFMAQLRRAISNIAAPVVQEKQEPVAWTYTINNSHSVFSTEKPPEDAYDEGTLYPLYAAPVVQPDMVMEAYAKHERSLGAEKAMASDLRERNAAWWALVMGAAAALEDAANFLSDSDAKRAASLAANHYRIAANALWPNA